MLLRSLLDEAARAIPPEPHEVPSASTVNHCRLQQWFAGKGFPPSDPPGVASRKRMESGKRIEGWWRELYTRAGFYVVADPPRARLGALSGLCDAVLIPRTSDARNALGADKAILELKDLGVWALLNVIDKGLQEGHPDYYTQVQLYMRLYDMPVAVFHAGVADPSAWTWIWRTRRRGETAPEYYVELVQPNTLVQADAIIRAEQVAQALTLRRPPLQLRDYNPGVLIPRRGFPCAYCEWRTLCLNEVRHRDDEEGRHGEQIMTDTKDDEEGRNKDDEGESETVGERVE